jgi:hypothetical protein
MKNEKCAFSVNYYGCYRKCEADEWSPIVSERERLTVIMSLYYMKKIFGHTLYETYKS